MIQQTITILLGKHGEKIFFILVFWYSQASFSQTDSVYSIQIKGINVIHLTKTKQISPSDSIILSNYGLDFSSLQAKLPENWTIQSITAFDSLDNSCDYYLIPAPKIKIHFAIKEKQIDRSCINEVSVWFFNTGRAQDVSNGTTETMIFRSDLYPPMPDEYYNDKYLVLYWDCYCKNNSSDIDRNCSVLKDFLIKHFNLI
ncbi:hypothetical protein SDC9_50635 [bioreactor metagenome]|uniref:Uncharacterized protein n=1 Tax=bioreactor metagenome TaxID=1076179 RepID=A0A644WLI1_9ZZZZ